jgi:hypothetical protein
MSHLGTFRTCRDSPGMSAHRSQSGKHVLGESISPFDPKATSSYLRHNARPVGFRHQLDLYEPFEPSLDVSYVPRIYEVPS